MLGREFYKWPLSVLVLFATIVPGWMCWFMGLPDVENLLTLISWACSQVLALALCDSRKAKRTHEGLGVALRIWKGSGMSPCVLQSLAQWLWWPHRMPDTNTPFIPSLTNANSCHLLVYSFTSLCIKENENHVGSACPAHVGVLPQPYSNIFICSSMKFTHSFKNL